MHEDVSACYIPLSTSVLYHSNRIYKAPSFMYVIWLQNQNSDTPLHLASANGHYSLAKELIEMYQLDPNAVTKVVMSNGALQTAWIAYDTMLYYWHNVCGNIYFLSCYGSRSKIASFTSSVTITHPVFLYTMQIAGLNF